MRQWTICALACALAGCTPAAVDSTATVVLPQTLASDGTPGTGKVHIVFPCHISDFLTPAMLKTSGLNILLDGKPAAQINTCQYRQITVPAGKHAIRVAGQFMDVGALFGNGPIFAIPAKGTVYFLVRSKAEGPAVVHDLAEVSAKEAAAAIDTINITAKGAG